MRRRTMMVELDVELLDEACDVLAELPLYLALAIGRDQRTARERGELDAFTVDTDSITVAEASS